MRQILLRIRLVLIFFTSKRFKIDVIYETFYKECLRAVSNKELHEATFGPRALIGLWADEITGTTKKAEPYAPIIHSDYLKDHPFDMWANGKRADVPIYIETAKEEGEIFIELIFYPFGRNDFIGDVELD